MEVVEGLEDELDNAFTSAEGAEVDWQEGDNALQSKPLDALHIPTPPAKTLVNPQLMLPPTTPLPMQLPCP